jgi:TrpR family trp operon transcriptional repressor
MTRTKAKSMLGKMLADIQDKNEVLFFLGQVLTNAEINDVIDRVRIYQTLACTEIPQRECAKKLNVSISKVTRGAANLHNHKAKAYWQSKFEGHVAL